MAEGEYIFPRWYFSAEEPNGRQFNTKDEFDAAGGQAVWKFTPQEATPPVPPTPAPAAHDEGESPTPRSRR
jgi:hypothetical protein